MKRFSFRRLSGLTAATAAFIVLSACGNQMSQGSGPGSMAGMDMGVTTKSAKGSLVPSNAVTGSGHVTVVVVNTQVHVDIRAEQLAASTKYTVHLHRGSCAARGDIVKTIGDLQTDTSGAGGAHLAYPGKDLPKPSFVDVHSPNGTEGPAVCGDLE